MSAAAGHSLLAESSCGLARDRPLASILSCGVLRLVVDPDLPRDLHPILQVRASTHTTKHLFYCDKDEDLLNRIAATSQDHACWDNPNHCLASEYDLESGIVDILHRLPFKISCLHVEEGHQDDDTRSPVQPLPWEAQRMNCHADTPLVTDCLDNWSKLSKVAPFTPTSKLSFFIAGCRCYHHLQYRTMTPTCGEQPCSGKVSHGEIRLE